MNTFRRIAFYFVAHADDWQLFMEPGIGHDIVDETCKVIIVHTTAGDAGNDEHYWQPREQAAIDSLLFRLSMETGVRCMQTAPDIHHKKCISYAACNCTCYFLRLPDGNSDGNGFERYQYQSLAKLHAGSIPAIVTVDSDATYTGWEELRATIDALIEMEKQAASGGSTIDVTLHFPENDRSLNPHDHIDHYYTSQLLHSTRSFHLYKKRSYLHYPILNGREQLSEEELFWKIGMFTNYHYSLFRQIGHSTMAEDPSYFRWCFSKPSFREL